MLCIRLISRSSEGYLADVSVVDISTDDDLLLTTAIKLTSPEQMRRVVSHLRDGLEEAGRMLDAASGEDPAELLRGGAMWLKATFDSAADISC